MTLQIRFNDKWGNPHSITDTEIYLTKDAYLETTKTELHSVILVDGYTRFLVNNIKMYKEIISDFQYIQELRYWLYEISDTNRNWTIEKHNKAIQFVKEKLREICVKYEGLYLIVD